MNGGTPGPTRGAGDPSGRSLAIGLILAGLVSAGGTWLQMHLGPASGTAIPLVGLVVVLAALTGRWLTVRERLFVVAMVSLAAVVVSVNAVTMVVPILLGSTDAVYASDERELMFGALAGVLLVIPFRRWFVAAPAERLPFPTLAAVESFVRPPEGSAARRPLFAALGVGALFELLTRGFGLWRDEFTTALVPAFDKITYGARVAGRASVSAAALGIGYLVGLRLASTLVAGALTAWIVIPAVVTNFGVASIPPPLNPETSDQGALASVFGASIQPIAVGAMLVASLIVAVRMLGTLWNWLFASSRPAARDGAPTDPAAGADDDLPRWLVVLWLAGLVALQWWYFWDSSFGNRTGGWLLAGQVTGLVLTSTFVFSMLASWSVAVLGVTPFAGFSLVALLVVARLVLAIGIGEGAGMELSLRGGAMVCTAMAGAAVTVLLMKLAARVGASPRVLQAACLLGAIVGTVVLVRTGTVLEHVVGFVRDIDHAAPLPTPRAHAATSLLNSMIGFIPPPTPWAAYAVGGLIPLVLEFLGGSGLAFALGMYLPLGLSSTVLLGAFVAWWLGRGGTVDALAVARTGRGRTLAAGLLAGSAVMGLLLTVLRVVEESLSFHLVPDLGNTGPQGNWMGLGALVALAVGLALAARGRKRPAPDSGETTNDPVQGS